MSNIDKQALREVAEKATPGPWLWINTGSYFSFLVPQSNQDPHNCILDDGSSWGEYGETINPESPDGVFIAAANPAAVLALLDELEAADALNKHFELAIRKAEGCSEALRRKAEAAEKRISELEAREVNLPKLSVGEVMHMSGFSRDYAEGWCSGNDNAIHEIHAAGVKVAAAAGKGE
ncbi:TPA: ead/Ea22-like family protein [Enterobacter hormaechei]|uniref:ead/Ea22-like family protein n=1 Tax=Enterobacter hormaechei TaxID=158836 RepID=UPI0007990E2C|nr:ead/Ea22-like family protein [Enterobacter hormaechei]CZW99434.1 Uncharacterised protein [Enterobacter hormaechei]